MAMISFRQKTMFGDFEPIVFLAGSHDDGVRLFVYLCLSFEQLARLNSGMDRGKLVRLAEYGKVVPEGIEKPDIQHQYSMERYYAFDHTDPLADDEDGNCVVFAA